MLDLAVKFYTVFVLQQLWNWFATVALHVEQISYMFGLGLFGSLAWRHFAATGNLKQEDKFNRVFSMIEASIPADGRSNAMAAIDLNTPDEANQAGLVSGWRAFYSTLFLAVGWAIHSFVN